MNDFNSIQSQILARIQSSNNILLHLHPSPDPDCVGGSLALLQALKSLGKQATLISGDSPKSASFSNLPGYDQVVSQSFSSTDLSQFDLFIILDSSSHEKITRISPVVFPSNLFTIVIDHHATNPGFANLNLVDTSPSICQTLYYLFQTWNIKITPDMAANLYIGMYGDTGGFKYFGTTTQTLHAASQVASINSDFPNYIFQLDNSNHPDLITYLGLAMSNVSLYSNSRIAISAVSNQDITKHNLKPEHFASADIANQLKSVIGYEIGISMIEIEPSVVKISMRTRQPDKYQVSAIAQSLGGGGHPAAAGITLSMSLDQAIATLVNTIHQHYPQEFPL